MFEQVKHKTKRDVQRRARELGATIAINSEAPQLDVGVMAPGWHHWQGEDVHELIGCQHDGESAGEVWDDLWHRMTGVQHCTPETCQAWDNGRCSWWGFEPEEGGAA